MIVIILIVVTVLIVDILLTRADTKRQRIEAIHQMIKVGLQETEHKKFKAEHNVHHHGFQMTFANRCTISVQFRKGNYSDGGETNAEVAAWDENSNWMVWDGDNWDIILDGSTDVMPLCTPDDIAKMINELVKFK
jgi:hypothetical protein